MKIDLEKTQNMLDWLKTKLFLDSIANKSKNRIVHRGEVYECNFGIGIGSEMQKDRPCVIVQGNVGNINSSNVIVAPITHTDKSLPCMAKINPQSNSQGIILDGFVNLSNIQTVSKARLGNYITRLLKNDMKEIDNALYVSIGLIKNIKKVFTNYFFNSIIKLQIGRFYVNDSIILTNIKIFLDFLVLNKNIYSYFA